MLKMLITDDEPMALVSASHAFTAAGGGFDPPVKVSDAYEALRVLRETRIDLCVIDIRMPGMNGIDMMDCCVKEGIPTKFVVLSGYSDFSYAQKAMAVGAVDYCLKPIDDGEAKRIVARLEKVLIEERKKEDRAFLREMSTGSTKRLPYFGADFQSFRVAVGGGAVGGASFYLEDRVVTLTDGRASLSLPGGSLSGDIPPEKLGAAVLRAMAMNREEMESGQGFQTYVNESFLRLKDEAEASACRGPSLTELAKKYSLNYNYCSELFRKTTGKSFVEFVTGKRMERAASLLLRTGMSVTSVAIEAGYSDYHYFANVFKSYYGVTPSEYRAEGKAGERAL